VDLALPEVAEQFAAAADRALLGAGGLELARRAEVDPALRLREVKDVLDTLGVPDLDPRADLDSAIMAAELVRIAGRYVIPFPVVAYVAARPEDGMPVALASAPPLRVDHGGLFARWKLHEFGGAAFEATPAGRRLASRLAPFVTDLAPQGPREPSALGEVELLCVLWSSYLLGVSEHAVELAVDHVQGRIQFGRPLSDLQSVRFQVADATVAVDGLRELIHFSLWRLATDPVDALSDALAVHFSAQEVAQPVLRLAQQLHGAAGMADEYDISVLVRHVQPALRLPVDSDALSDILFDAINTRGFSTLFPLRSVDVLTAD
jgi:3-oxo-4-pregnene-20-carboxyl-CoA dehydrogenase alpha subunit